MAEPFSNMTYRPALLLLCVLLCPCQPLDVYHLNPDPNTPKEVPVSPRMTIAEDPVGKLPPQFSLCASFYQGLRTRATGDQMMVDQFTLISLTWLNWPIQSLSRNVRLCVCVSLCVPFFAFSLNVLLGAVHI